MIYVLIFWAVILAIFTPWFILAMEWKADDLGISFTEYIWWCCKPETIMAIATTVFAVAVLVVH